MEVSEIIVIDNGRRFAPLKLYISSEYGEIHELPPLDPHPETLKTRPYHERFKEHPKRVRK